MGRRILASVITVAALFLQSVPPAQAGPLHDFDPSTLASYVSLRFSSAVPPNVIRLVLAGEGFSQANLDLISADAAAVGAPSIGPGKPGVAHAQQISKDPLPCPPSDSTPCQLDTEVEPDIAVNPTKSGNVVAVFQQGRFQNGGAVDNGWATSLDGGKTWPYRGSAPGLTVAVSPGSTEGPGAPFARASDPVVAFDTKHKSVFLQSLSVDDPGCAVFCDSAVTLNISNNRGQNFGPPVIAHEDVFTPEQQPVTFNDKNWIVTDNNRSSPFYGRTYSVWDQLRCADNGCFVITSQPVVLRVSDDGGKTWGPLVDATHEQPAPAHAEVGVQPVVMPNGDVVIVYADVQAGLYTFEGSYKAIRSTDGGQTWSEPVTITAADPFAEESASLRAPNVPSAAVDADGTIYVAFQDQRFASGRNDVLLTTSRDEGGTWSPPINVTPGEAGLDHFTPDVAVVDGTVHLAYRTRLPGNVNDAPFVDAVYRAVRNEATIFGPVNLYSPSDAGVAAFTTVAGVVLKFFGDYAGITASSAAAHPVWDHSGTFPDQEPNPTNTHSRSFSAKVVVR